MIDIFTDLSLRTKQSIGFGIFLIIMASVNIFSLLRLNDLKADLDSVTNEWLPSVVAISDINLHATDYRRYELSHAVTEDTAQMRKYEIEMSRLKTLIRQSQDVYAPLLTEIESPLYDSFVLKWDRYLIIHEEFLNFSRKNNNTKAIDILNDESKIIFLDFTKDLEELVKINKERSLQAGKHAEKTYENAVTVTLWLFLLTFILSFVITWFLVKAVTVPLSELSKAVDQVAKGNINVSIGIKSKDEIGKLTSSFNKMTISLRQAKEKNNLEDWLKTGQNQLNEMMHGDQDVQTLAKSVVTYLAKYLQAQVGALYLANDDSTEFSLVGSYAFTNRKSLNKAIKIGEGLVGQAAYEKEIISLTNIPDQYMRIHSAIGEMNPKNIVIAPFMYEETVVGLLEFGTFNEFGARDLEFLKGVTENIAINFNSAQSRNKIKYLLQESQRQAYELQAQQEELRAANEELESQTAALKESEMQLKAQQEELQATNEELEEKTQYLQQQKNEISIKNNDLEQARHELEKKAKELEMTGKYKSEFLANMSHELRTPLNSLLILARSLSENKKGNLNNDQIQSAQIIYRSGNDLLSLINDILDLSKIEAGKMNFHIESIDINEITADINNIFTHMTKEKGLFLDIQVEKTLPVQIHTDSMRLQQVIKNLMSNAIKFTSQGGITLKFFSPPSNTNLTKSGLKPNDSIGISVVDTGIGIPTDKQMLIFEAFQQADGSTSRQFGGTGLGLSISREITKNLGGEIQISSIVGKGSTFTIYLPLESKEVNTESKSEGKEHEIVKQQVQKHEPIIRTERPTFAPILVKDDREYLNPIDRSVLVMEDDVSFSKILLDQCHEKSFKCITCTTGEEGLELAEKYVPSAIILDLKLPRMSGWEVLEKLKQNPKTRHIPVHIMSVDDSKSDALQRGAIGFFTKPVQKEQLEETLSNFSLFIDKKVKDLLLLEDDAILRNAIKGLLGEQDLNITEAETGMQAIEYLKVKKFDCMVMDLGLPDMTGFQLLDKVSLQHEFRLPPIIVYTGKDLTREEEQTLRKYADSIIIKGVKSEERLLDETALFLHRFAKNMPAKIPSIIQETIPQQPVIMENPHDKDLIFKNKKILLVDDDMRNVFAMSRVLEEKDMIISKAENGQKALQVLEGEEKFDLVLMDIMMPIMDGYETMRRIRMKHEFDKLPIIALTAKAMREDRDKCIESGASDYLTKPVDIERLLSMMRVWLYK
ncbi:MAG: response regulator [Bacteroidetes bacterium]|nr:MAG: response regulator [Bacteroidota bacterium]